MPISARVLKDSMAPCGKRLLTFECTYPRSILAELMTHRMLSKSSASSRAIPIAKMLQRVEEDLFTPLFWSKNEPGMQAREEVEDKDAARAWWLESAHMALAQARKGAALGLHKQLVNRVVEPYMHITTLVSGTEWGNFFFLRDHPDAEPHFEILAKAMRTARGQSTPEFLRAGEWHMPFIQEGEYDTVSDMFDAHDHPAGVDRKETITRTLRQISVGRCCRVSYLNHHGKRDLIEDIQLHDKLLAGAAIGNPLHMSPFEHVAMALDTKQRSGNYVGWHQMRKDIKGEAGPDE